MGNWDGGEKAMKSRCLSSHEIEVECSSRPMNNAVGTVLRTRSLRRHVPRASFAFRRNDIPELASIRPRGGVQGSHLDYAERGIRGESDAGRFIVPGAVVFIVIDALRPVLAMPEPAPNPAVISNLLTTQNSLIQTICSFLTVSIHQILYLRQIYPPVSFISARAYNYAVRQNRHPGVCEWVNSAIAAVRDQLQKSTVERVAVCIFECEENQVLERWTFDLRALPVVDPKERDTPFDASEEGKEAEGAETQAEEERLLRKKINLADLEAQFSAMLARLNGAAGKLKPLPKDLQCSFTVTIEVKEDADRPVGRLHKEERQWVAAEPEVWRTEEADIPEDKEDAQMRRHGSRGRTVPIRRLEAGELRLEFWVEESKAKFDKIHITNSVNNTLQS